MRKARSLYAHPSHLCNKTSRTRLLSHTCLFPQIRVNAAGALLHDWAKEQAAIQRLIDEGRVVLL